MYTDEYLKLFSVKSSDITINGDIYKNVAKRLAFNEFPYPRYDQSQFPEDNMKFAKFIVLSNIINFATFTPIKNKLLLLHMGVEYKGSEALAMALKLAIDQDLIELDFGYFASNIFTSEILNQVFSIIQNSFFDGRGVLLADQRFLMIKNFSKEFIAKYKYFEEFLSLCQGSALSMHGLVSRLSLLSGYDKDKEFLNKRASLCAYMIHSRGVETQDKVLQFDDADRLPPLADSQIFRYMLAEQIIYVHPYFLYRLHCKTIFDENDSRDLSYIHTMRSVTIVAMALLLEAINHLRTARGFKKINMIQLDSYLWRRSRSGAYGDTYYPYMLTTNC